MTVDAGRCVFYADLADQMPKRVGRPIDGTESTKAYWSERAGVQGGVHPTVARAVNLDPNICDRAWARVRDKEDDARNPDLTQATRLKNRQAYFVYWLKRGIAEYEEQKRHERANKVWKK